MITVVIIDDDPFVTKSLQTILESTKEIRVLGIGHCAKDALVLYETHRPDVLLTDIRMPKQTRLGLRCAVIICSCLNMTTADI